MLLEELTQGELDNLVARAKQRTVFAAVVAGVMSLDLTSKEGLAIQRTIITAVMTGMDMGLRVGDNIEHSILVTMKEYCEQQIVIEDLLNSVNL